MGWRDVAPSDEVGAADWIQRRLHPFAQDVGSVVPTGFGAYARIFHPATSAGQLAAGRVVPGVEMRWSDVAARSGKTVHAEMQFQAIAAPAPDSEPQIYQPQNGVLSKRQSTALVALLSQHTATPGACWLCLWEGYGDLNPGATASLTAWFTEDPPGLRPKLPKPPGFGFGRFRMGMPKVATRGFPERSRVKLPARDYLLFTGSVTEAQGWDEGPNLWWPDDQSWCVASEIDFPYTYVGGSPELVDAIIENAAIEALPAKLTDGVIHSSDTVNS
jgi:hypothetical protein